MKPDTTSTHQQYAVPPQRFRAQATGVGNTVQMSAATGAMRADCVVGAMPAAQRAAIASSEGYPVGGGTPR